MEAGEQYLVFCKDSVDREIVRVHPNKTTQEQQLKKK